MARPGTKHEDVRPVVSMPMATAQVRGFLGQELPDVTTVAANSTAEAARIVGEDGEHADELRRRVAALGLEEHVELAGPRGQAALLEDYRRASAFCLPCRILASGDRDGIPNVLVEAMACGVPVVTTPVSGIPELVRDGENGLLVPPDDPDALAAAILRLRDDPALHRRLAEAGRATVRAQFDGDRLAGDLVALFRQAAR
jgi:glycosyltransferase involved in cell wall biosynthesis